MQILLVLAELAMGGNSMEDISNFRIHKAVLLRKRWLDKKFSSDRHWQRPDLCKLDISEPLDALSRRSIQFGQFDRLGSTFPD